MWGVFTSSACSRASGTCGRPAQTVLCRWVRGTANPADPISKLHDLDGDLAMAREVATRRVGDLWVFPDRKTVFLWTMGIPMGPFVLP